MKLFSNLKFCLASLALFILCKTPEAQTTYWWNDAVFYEAFVRSFYDSNNDGHGDLQGLIDKLDYLSELGVDAIWLMPVCPSPSYHGYDITNYKAVQPVYGTKQDFINFADSAHKRGIKVIFDFVMNHTSSDHPWFLNSEANDPFYRNFYRWSSTDPGTIGPWGQQVWHEYNSTNYYYGLFWSGMPDINYEDTIVKDSMFSVAQFWLDSMHVDGFRLDAAPYIFEEGNWLENVPATFQFWHDFHTYYKSVNDSSMTVGEVGETTDSILPYVVGGDKLDFCFEFDLASQIIAAVNTAFPSQLRVKAQQCYDDYPYLQFGTFLTNHDQNRVFDDLGGSIPKMKAAAAIYLTLPGIPFIYYGEEIGMSGTGDDPSKRRPMQWTAGTHAGFSNATPWEAINNNYATYNVATEQTDSNSILNWYKKLISIRHEEVALRRGDYFAAAEAPTQVFSFIRTYESDTDIVLVNTGNQTYTDFTLNLSGSGINPGYKLFTDLINGGWWLGDLDSAFNLGTFEIGPYQTLIYRMESSTGIANVQSNSLANIFPNPAGDQFMIEMNSPESLSYSLHDLQGKILKSENINSNASRIAVDVKNFPAGIYFLELNDGKRKQFFKVVISR